MTIPRKDLIALADMIRQHNRIVPRLKHHERFTQLQLKLLAAFCESQNPSFDRKVWLGYIAGKCKPTTNDVVEAMVEIIDGEMVFSTAPEPDSGDSAQQWDEFRELVHRVKEDPDLLRHNPDGLPLSQVTRSLVDMVYNSDSLSQFWNPGHRVWDLLCVLVAAADPELAKMPRKQMPEPPLTPEKEQERKERMAQARALVGKRVRVSIWPDREESYAVATGFFESEHFIGVTLEGHDGGFNAYALVVHPDDVS